MAEYIDREALYEKAYWHGEHPDVGNPFPDGVDAIDIKDVDAIPAADVAPVVHCKDCAHRTEMGNCGHPRYHGILPSAYPYDFCSYGERMDGDDDAEAD